MGFVPFAVQGLLMGVDEFYCHLRRPLRRWERLGHPSDTLLFLSCLLWLLTRPPGPGSVRVYIALSAASCLFVTKDEWQHRELCTGFENWLHALLFMLHPLLLVWAGWLWWTADGAFHLAVGGAAGMSAAFAVYQFIYWNMWRRDQQ